MPTFYFETDPPGDEGDAPRFGGPADVLVYFLSLVFSTRYGSQHPLSQLALILRGQHKIDLAPLSTFADREVEVEADARDLERAWQDARPLAETLARVVEVLEACDEQVQALIADTPDLVDRLRDLREMAARAADRGARARMTFEL